MHPILSACLRESGALLALTRELVASESPSSDRAALDACAELLALRLIGAGAAVERRGTDDSTAAPVIARWPGAGPRVLLLGHLDTVWPIGQLRRQPLEERDGRLFGPGVYDMKAGLAIAMTAIRVLLATVPAERRPHVTWLITTDEEVGSRTSRALIEQLARESAAVLVTEPALPNGGVKTSRKGVGEFVVGAQGVSSHAGADPSQGASAIHELARQILAVQALADPSRGLTVNVGVIEGGTRSNVVAERARAIVDVRVSRIEDAPEIERAIRALRPSDPRVTLSVSGGVNRPPMERGPGVAALVALAKAVASDLGWTLEEGGTGGGSDGNFSAALGVPTLDGLGAMGDGAHALHEHVVIKELAPRAALLAGVLGRLGDNGWRETNTR